MKKILDIHRRCSWLCLPIPACQILPDRVQASTRARIPLLEAADLSARSLPIVGRRIGVSSMELYVGQKYRLLTSQARKPQTIEKNARQMRIEDRGHLALKCSYVSGSQILIRSLPGQTLTVTAAYGEKLLVPSPLPAEPRTSGGLFSPLPDAPRQGT
jgi:hypothetical protein